MSQDFFNSIIDKIDNASVSADGKSSAEFAGYIDSGSYILNAVLSGSIFGGYPDNKITMLAGESSTGKTFLALDAIKAFLNANEGSSVFYFDTESAISSHTLSSRGIDPKRVIIIEPVTVEEFRHKAVVILNRYIAAGEDRPKTMFVLDSLGQLSTNKEINDITDGKDVRDMTKSQLIKAAFRVLDLKLAKAGVPMIVNNHVYAKIGSMFPENELAGGSGSKYTADQIVMLSKKKDKEGTEVIGNIVHCKMYKSRLSVENKMVDIKVSYTSGLDRYYGLLELAERAGVFKKISTRYELPDGSKIFGKAILREPEKYFTVDVMQSLDAQARKEFTYGTHDDELEEIEDDS